MRLGLLFCIAFWTCVLLFTTGCSGIGISHTLETYRIDRRAQNSETYNKPGGLRCWFTDCQKEANSNPEASGS